MGLGGVGVVCGDLDVDMFVVLFVCGFGWGGGGGVNGTVQLVG